MSIGKVMNRDLETIKLIDKIVNDGFVMNEKKPEEKEIFGEVEETEEDPREDALLSMERDFLNNHK